MNKKDLPLKVLKALEPFVDLHGKLFEVINNDKRLLTIKDKDENSKFCFYISGFDKREGKFIFNIAYSPFSDNVTDLTQNKVFIENLQEAFKSWVGLLEQYDATNSFFDDPILQSYQAEFISNFELLDEEAEKTPFQTAQILQLDYLLEHVSNRLIEISDDNNREVNEEIVAEIAVIRENLTNRSQKWVVDKISNIYAKIAKQGVSFIKEFWAEGKKELIKIGMKAIIESAQNMIN